MEELLSPCRVKLLSDIICIRHPLLLPSQPLTLSISAGYNLIVDFLPSGLQEADFPSRVLIDTFLYSSTLNKQLRVACFGEFDGWDTRPTPCLSQDLLEQAGRMFPSLQQALAAAPTQTQTQTQAMSLPKGMEIRTGLRPFVSDGRLLVGRVPEYHNLSVNVGPGFNGTSEVYVMWRRTVCSDGVYL